VKWFSNSPGPLRPVLFPVAFVGLVFAGLLAASAPRPDEPPTDAVGVIDGDSIAVSGPMTVEVIKGQTKTLLRSGSDVRVKSGSARIDLMEGGQITICGPAHFSLLKAGGALTVALDTGTVHIHVDRTPPVNIYTPQVQAQTVAVADGPRDVLIGFDTAGAMCLRANRGAVRLEQQLTGQTVLVPQAGDIVLINGQLDGLRTNSGGCMCELLEPKLLPHTDTPAPRRDTAEVTSQPTPDPKPRSQPVLSNDPPGNSLNNSPSNSPNNSPSNSPNNEEPITQVLMPPLVYDSSAKAQPEVDPNMLVFIRRVRVRPTLIFQGRVETPKSLVPAPPVRPAAAAAAPVAPKPTAPAAVSLFTRIRNFFRRLWSSS